MRERLHACMDAAVPSCASRARSASSCCSGEAPAATVALPELGAAGLLALPAEPDSGRFDDDDDEPEVGRYALRANACMHMYACQRLR